MAWEVQGKAGEEQTPSESVGFHGANLNSESQTRNASLFAPLSLRVGLRQFPKGLIWSLTAVSKTHGLSQEVISSQLMASPLMCAACGHKGSPTLWPNDLPKSHPPTQGWSGALILLLNEFPIPGLVYRVKGMMAKWKSPSLSPPSSLFTPTTLTSTWGLLNLSSWSTACVCLSFLFCFQLASIMSFFQNGPTILRTLAELGNSSLFPHSLSYCPLTSTIQYGSHYRNEWTWNRMHYSVYQLHQPYFKCSMAPCGQKLPHRTAQTIHFIFADCSVGLAQCFPRSCWLVSSFYVAGTLWTVLIVVISTPGFQLTVHHVTRKLSSQFMSYLYSLLWAKIRLWKGLTWKPGGRCGGPMSSIFLVFLVPRSDCNSPHMSTALRLLPQLFWDLVEWYHLHPENKENSFVGQFCFFFLFLYDLPATTTPSAMHLFFPVSL